MRMSQHQHEEPAIPKLRIAIIGAGIGGLTLSAALGATSTKNDIVIDIYEKAAVLSEIGAGITLWPRFFQILNNIGLGKTLLQYLPRPPDGAPRLVFQLRKADQREGVFVRDIIMKGGSMTLHRADLQQALLTQLHGTLHLGHRLSTIEDTGNQIVMHFANGTTSVCDLVIGMDGLRSTVRKCLLLKQGLPHSPTMKPIWSGAVVYRDVVPRDTLDAVFPGHRTITTPMYYLGKQKRIVVYSISRNLINVAALVTYPEKEGTEYDDTPRSPEDLRKEVIAAYSQWEPEVQVLIQCMKQPTKWPIEHLLPLERYVSGRIILAGDAAHGKPPHQGTGAGVAIEDAYILANLLSSEACTKQNILQVAELYNSIRCPAGNKALKQAIDMGKRLNLEYHGLESLTEGDEFVSHDVLDSLGKSVSEIWEWVWMDTAEGGKVSAMEMLKSLAK